MRVEQTQIVVFADGSIWRLLVYSPDHPVNRDVENCKADRGNKLQTDHQHDAAARSDTSGAGQNNDF